MSTSDKARFRYEARAAITPALCVAFASLLHASGELAPGNSGRFGPTVVPGQQTTTGLLAGLLAHESAVNFAVRQDGTLTFDAEPGASEADGDASRWVAATESDAVTGGAAVGDEHVEPVELASGTGMQQTAVRAGMSLSRTGHVSIVPPFVVLSRGSESIMLSLESGSAVVPEHRLPSWATQPRPNGRVVADFGWRGTVEVQATSVMVRRRSLEWHLPGTAI